MKKLFIILVLLLIPSYGECALTVGNIPKVKTGGTTPAIENSSLSESGGNLTATGTVTASGFIGNASTATSLNANGANCSAGNAPLGVDASGAVESCFDVWTQAENTSAAYLSIETNNLETVTTGILTGEIPIGTGSGVSTYTTISGDATISSAGSLQLGSDVVGSTELSSSGVVATSYTLMNATVDADGRITAATSSTNIAGNAGTATALAANGTNCSESSYPLGVDASGNVESCGTTISGNAGTATALAANGSNCSSGNYPLGVDASGAVENCTADDDVPESGDFTNLTGTTPITVSGGAVSIANAVADGSTKGAASFDSTDFSASSGNISLGASPTVTTQFDIGGNSTSAGILKLLEDTDDGTNYLTFKTAARASNLDLIWNITAATCSGDGNGGALTVNGSNEIVCSADDGGAGGSGDVTDVGDCATGACFTGASGTLLQSNTDLIMELDNDNNGTESFQVKDGADTMVAEVAESGIINTLVGLDAIGAVDLDYGSADVTDHTFISDNGTNVVLDGTASTIGTSAILHNDAIDASSELAAIMDDETGNDGSSLLVFNDNPSLTGATLAAELFVDATGAEFEPGDALTNCSTFSATGGGIFYDDSEGKFKKCQDNTLTDLDTGGSEVNNLETVTTGILSGEMVLGNSSGTSNYVTMSGDATITSAGVISLGSGVVDAAELASTAVVTGTYEPMRATVDADGRLTAASSSTTNAITAVIENLDSADDDMFLKIADANITIQSCWCRTSGFSTQPTIALQNDAGGNLTGAPTCNATSGYPGTPITGAGAVTANVGLTFDVTNTPVPIVGTKTILECTYSRD